MNVSEFEANLDPEPRDMEEFSLVHEDVAKRVADAREGLARADLYSMPAAVKYVRGKNLSCETRS